MPAVAAVPGGTFLMGATGGRADEAPPHRVTLTGFALGRHPVTNAEYTGFLGEGRAEKPPWWGRPGFGDPEQPVVGVTWFDAVAYVAWLSERTGATYRLPTEAEWERAASAEAAWPPPEVPAGPIDGPWAVAQGRPNAFGLFDLGTIVHEWCADWYDATYYNVSPAVDPRGPAAGTRRSSRGGSWRHHVRWSRPSARSSLPPHLRYADYGFRVLREA